MNAGDIVFYLNRVCPTNFGRQPGDSAGLNIITHLYRQIFYPKVRTPVTWNYEATLSERPHAVGHAIIYMIFPAVWNY